MTDVSSVRIDPYLLIASDVWARVCFAMKLALLCKKCLLKNWDPVQPKPDLARVGAVSLRHDVVMLGGEEI